LNITLICCFEVRIYGFTKIIFINKVFSSVVWRININHFQPTGIRLLQNPQDLEIVTLNHQILRRVFVYTLSRCWRERSRRWHDRKLLRLTLSRPLQSVMLVIPAHLGGVTSIFFLDAITFLISAILILTLPRSLNAARDPTETSSATTWRDVRDGTTRLWADAPMRYALLLELVASVAGALVLVNTVGLVRGSLALNDVAYGWVMVAFGVGATLAALAAGALEKRLPRTRFVLLGAVVTTLAVIPANFVPFAPLLALWLVVGAGQNWVNLPTQTLIADRTPTDAQGRVYGAHFAWSHLWWALAYPLAGWLGSSLTNRGFLYGGLIGLLLLIVVQVFLVPRGSEHEKQSTSG
jgi:predicted MFS family arabinose efflux permease